jgi:putative heme transporter
MSVLSDADPELPEIPPPLGEVDGCGRPDSRLRRMLRTVVPLAIAAAVLVTGISFAGGIGDAFRAVEAMDPGWLAVALVMEVVSYGWLGLHLRWLAGPADNAERAAPLRTALVIFGLGSVLPAAPVEGLTIASAALKKRRLDRRRIALLLGFSQWFSTRGLFALAALDAVIASAVSDVPGPYRGSVFAGGLVTMAALAATTWLSTKRRFAEWLWLAMGRLRHVRHPEPATERRARGAAWHAAAMHVAGRSRDRVVLMGTTVAAWAADGLCLHFALVAAGAHASIDVLLLAYTAGAMASTVPLLPAGLGVVEAVTPIVLHHYGIPIDTALAAVLAYRFLGTLMPALAGALALVGLQIQSPAEQTPVPAPSVAAANL